MLHAILRQLALAALALPALACAQTSTLDKIKQSGTMTLAYRESSIPFSYPTTRRSRPASASRSAKRSPTASRQRPGAAT